MSTGGYIRSSKLSASEYFKFDVKKKLSLIIYSLLFSNKIAPLKNSSLDAKNGLNVNLVSGKDCFMVFIILFLKGVRVGHSRRICLMSSVAELQWVQVADGTPLERRWRDDLVSLCVKQQRM